MTNKQKRAIGNAIRKREKRMMEETIRSHGWETEFKESGYKSMLWFIRSKGVRF